MVGREVDGCTGNIEIPEFRLEFLHDCPARDDEAAVIRPRHEMHQCSVVFVRRDLITDDLLSLGSRGFYCTSESLQHLSLTPRD